MYYLLGLLFRCLYSERTGKIVINMCFAILLVNITYVTISLPTLHVNVYACVAAMAFFHVFLLAMMLWHLIEAVNMYQIMVTVFISYEAHFLLKRFAIAWGRSSQNS